MQINYDTESTPMRFVTYNLRHDAQPDNLTVQQSLDRLPDPLAGPGYLCKSGEQPWSVRRLHVAEQLLGEGVVLAGFQEALVRQVHDLAELFGSDWDWVGVGRDDGVEAGEYSPIFYKKSELVLLSYDSFWTSNTPFTPSRYPGAGSHRVCTVLHLQRRNGGQKFTVLNTHLDDQSEAQRRHAASMLLARARYEASATDGPVLVMGDFNSPPQGRDGAAYEIATGVRPPGALPPDFAAKYAVAADAPRFALQDLRACPPRHAVSANHATFTGFGAPNDTRAWSRIDFVFGGANGGWEATRYKVLSALSDDGVLASDHRPVFVDVLI
ncbi:Endonuclease/exonuclease/phosphatase [Mycena belliarum]|uniref:Endonuclease/exonuclease/phosphatase n=1 Tax=Mycena belliarum TaxID=1033014 RepID=A0AAD6UA02_9AGAR|nr:Endonuclease/exonuclease/phosphatase [Mycena belliae]